MGESVTLLFQANFLLVMIVAILLGMAVIGYRKGLIKMVVSVLSVLVTLVLVVTLQPEISSMLKETQIYEKLKTQTTMVIHDKVYEKLEQGDLWRETDNLEALTNELLERMNIPGEIQEFLKDSILKTNIQGTTMEGIANELSTQIGEKLADLVLDCGVFAVSYFLILACVKLLFGAVNLISYFPLIHGANKIAGFVLGLAEGVCIVWVFFLLLTTMGGPELDETLFPQIQGNPLLSFLYENNLLMKFIMK